MIHLGPAQELGRVAVELIMGRITATTHGDEPADQAVLLTPILTVRESTGPAPALSADHEPGRIGKEFKRNPCTS